MPNVQSLHYNIGDMHNLAIKDITNNNKVLYVF